jgi:hypothetical protein
MSRVRIYIDEDAMQRALVVALRARRIDVQSALDAGMINRGDEDHLRWSTKEERVLYSFNLSDYAVLHNRWLARGEVRWGIVLAPQQRYPVGEQLRRLLHLVNRRTALEMRQRLEFLSAWGR